MLLIFIDRAAMKKNKPAVVVADEATGEVKGRFREVFMPSLSRIEQFDEPRRIGPYVLKVAGVADTVEGPNGDRAWSVFRSESEAT